MLLHISIWLDYSENNNNCVFSEPFADCVRYGCHELILYYNYIYNLFLIWCGVHIIFSGNMYMFIITKLPYILYPILIYSCCLLSGFIISWALWPRIIRLGLCWCYNISFHGSMNSLSLAFDSRHCLGSCFIIHPVNIWSDSWCLTVFINIHYFYIAGILLQDISNFVYLFFFNW